MAFALLAALLAGILVVVIGRRGPLLAGLNNSSLRRAGLLTDGVSQAFNDFDATTLVLQAERGRVERAATFASCRPAGPLAGLLLLDATGFKRRWRELSSRFILLTFVWAAGAVFGSVGATVTLAVVVAAFIGIVTARLRTWLESSSLWRALPIHAGAVTATLCCAPAALLTLVAGVGAVGAGLPVTACALGIAAVASAVRRSRRPPIRFGSAVQTPAGPLEVGVVVHVVYGYEVVAVCAVLGLWRGWWTALGAAIICLILSVLSSRPGGE